MSDINKSKAMDLFDKLQMRERASSPHGDVVTISNPTNIADNASIGPFVIPAIDKIGKFTGKITIDPASGISPAASTSAWVSNDAVCTSVHGSKLDTSVFDKNGGEVDYLNGLHTNSTTNTTDLIFQTHSSAQWTWSFQVLYKAIASAVAGLSLDALKSIRSLVDTHITRIESASISTSASQAHTHDSLTVPSLAMGDNEVESAKFVEVNHTSNISRLFGG